MRNGRTLIPLIAPRSVARHYFDEQINTPSEHAEDGSLYSAYSMQSLTTQWWVILPLETAFDEDRADINDREPEPDEL